MIKAASSSAYAIELTTDNFHEMTDGKTVFIKFFAPWCIYSKSIKPDWDRLMSDFVGSSSQLVAEVDCTTAEGEPLCSEFGVQGYPTLMWGDPWYELNDYQGGRSYEELRQFADETLKPQCSIKNLDICDEDKRARIEKYLDMNVDELSAIAESEETKLKEAEEKLEKLHAGVEELYKEMNELGATEAEEMKFKEAEEKFIAELEKFYARHGELTKDMDDAVETVKLLKSVLRSSVIWMEKDDAVAEIKTTAGLGLLKSVFRSR